MAATTGAITDAINILGAVLPIVSQGLYLVTLLFSLYLTWLRVRDQDE